MNKKEKSTGAKKSNIERLKRVQVLLGRLEVELATKLGDGDLTLGIRRAVVIAGRQSCRGKLN